MAVYPNPANDLLNVAFDAGLPVDEVAWTLLDASGRVALSGRRTVPLNDPRMSIPVDALDPGSYLLLIRDLQGGSVAQARFVKQ
jgi:hypothetical protein